MEIFIIDKIWNGIMYGMDARPIEKDTYFSVPAKEHTPYIVLMSFIRYSKISWNWLDRVRTI